ncbi:MAG: hypothetical protein NWF00_08640 [Candidatus Bathyarchaeota archaeon]|nr:hypothetical protein [Candidatus Bathyarchaeota archaeon]
MKIIYVLRIALILTLTGLILVMQSASFIFAAYSVDSVEVSIQSPNGKYINSSIPLIAKVNFIYGTTSTRDEFSFQNVICSYRLDNGEWKNITVINVTSNASQPDINYWNGLLHKLNVTYSTVLDDLSEGLHVINVTVNANDTFGNINASDIATFSIVELPSNTFSPVASPPPTETHSPVQTLTPSPSVQSTETPKPQQQSPTENIYAIAAIVIVVIIIAVITLAKRR